MVQKFKGSLSLSFSLLWRCWIIEGSALPHFYHWKSCSIDGGEKQLKPFKAACRTLEIMLSGHCEKWSPKTDWSFFSQTLWWVCTLLWGPGQVHCSLSSEIGLFHHRKWDCICKDLEICCYFFYYNMETITLFVSRHMLRVSDSVSANFGERMWV